MISQLIEKYKEINKQRQIKKRQRDNNLHNFTHLSKEVLRYSIPFDEIVNVGKGTYGEINFRYFYNCKEKLLIGNYCSIAEGVEFLLGGEHPYKTMSTYPFHYYYNTGIKHITPTKGPIVVKDDVWIGQNSLILSGVTIGQGVIIGAGSVVSKDIPPYAIYAGGRIVKYRFKAETICKLCLLDYSKVEKEDIASFSEILNKEIDDSFFESSLYKTHLKNS